MESTYSDTEYINQKANKEKSLSKAKIKFTAYTAAVIIGGAAIANPLIGFVANNKVKREAGEPFRKAVNEYTYIVNANGDYAYKNDQIANNIANINGLNFDQKMYLLYTAYKINASKQMDEVLRVLKTEQLTNFDSFQEYINSLGYQDVDEYKQEMAKKVTNELLSEAKGSSLEYDYENNTFTFAENNITRG
jgi:hypothetical protein